jgi:hypothetical protein
LWRLRRLGVGYRPSVRLAGQRVRHWRQAHKEALAHDLNTLGERHKADHDVYHLTGVLLRIAHTNLERLAPHAERYGVAIDTDDGPDHHAPTLAGKAREKTAELIGRRPEPSLVLIHDLRTLHMLYAEASINYVIISQAAQAAADTELLDAISACHAQTLRGMKWTVTRLKTAAPHALTS